MLLMTKKCAKKLKMTEFDEVFSEEQQEALNVSTCHQRALNVSTGHQRALDVSNGH